MIGGSQCMLDVAVVGVAWLAAWYERSTSSEAWYTITNECIVTVGTSMYVTTPSSIGFVILILIPYFICMYSGRCSECACSAKSMDT
jgi:hypothetical protein